MTCKSTYQDLCSSQPAGTVIKKIFKVEKVDQSRNNCMEFVLNHTHREKHVVDTGADECMMSTKTAKRFLGADMQVESKGYVLELEGVWGEPRRASGYVTIPVTVEFFVDGKLTERTKDIEFWVFEGDAPVLFGMPAINQLGLGIVGSGEGPNENPTGVVRHEGVMYNLPLYPSGTEFIQRKVVQVTAEIPAVTTKVLEMQRGRYIIGVDIPDGFQGKELMFVNNVETSNLIQQGVIMENCICSVQGRRAHISLRVVMDHAILPGGTLLAIGIPITRQQKRFMRFYRNDLKVKGDRRARVLKTHLGTGDNFEETGRETTQVQVDQPEEKQEHTTNEKEEHDRFYEETRYKDFQSKGLKAFRPSKNEKERLQNIPSYDNQGNKIDTFDQLCKELLNAQETGVIYEKGTPLPIANTRVEVEIKENAKKVVAGYHQNDQSPAAKRLIQEQTDERERLGVVEPCNHQDIEYCSRIMLVPKPNGDWRFCVDLRGVNRNVEIEHWPLTKVDVRLQGMQGSQFFTTLDLPQAFHNIPIHENSQKYFGFMAPNGLYRYRTLPMGFVNSMALFTRLMDMAMIGLGDFVNIYVDDLIVFSPTWEEHLIHIREVFNRLAKAGLKVNLSKCTFAKPEVPFLGHIVSKDGIKMNPKKVEAINKMEIPSDISKLRSFLGATGQYRKFIQGYSKIAQPLTELTKKVNNFKEQIKNPECIEAFDKLKLALASEQVLAHPNLDKQWILSCDASSYGIGCVLQQRREEVDDKNKQGEYTSPKNKELRPVAYFSKKLTAQEVKSYSIYEKEAYAVVWGLEACKSYLMGSKHPILIFTDNKALTWLKDSEQPGRLGKWQAILNMYRTKVEHKPAIQNCNADCFSRNPGVDVTEVEIPGIMKTIGRRIYHTKRNQKTQDIVKLEYTETGVYGWSETKNGSQKKLMDCEELEEYWNSQSVVSSKTTLFNSNDQDVYGVILKKKLTRKEGTISRKERSEERQRNDQIVNRLIRIQTRSQIIDNNDEVREEREEESDISESDQGTIAVKDVTSLAQIVDYQSRDRTWNPIVKYLKKYQSCFNYDNISRIPLVIRRDMSDEDKRLFKIYKKSFILDRDGILRRKKVLKERGDQKEYQTLCVPSKLQKEVLRFHHGSVLSGHLGINKLEKIMIRRYHWPRMLTHIKKWVKGCGPCQRRKQYKREHYGLFRSRVSKRPWERVCIDLVGPLPETNNHNIYLLTMMDTFSRWPIAVPLPNKRKETIARALYKHLITVHGCPEELFSDQEATLLSDSVTLMCQNLGINRITSACYSPWQNGHIERFHRFLGASLSMYATRNKRDWDEWIDSVLFTYRVSVHAQTGESPYRILYNREPVLGGDILLNTYPDASREDDRSADEITKELYEWFDVIRKEQEERTKRYIDKKNRKEGRIEIEFKKDDWVLMYEPPVTHTTVRRPWVIPRKFQDVLTGPHRILKDKCNNKGEYLVYHTRREQEEWIHKRRLVTYNPWSDDLLDTAEGSMVTGDDVRQWDTGESDPAEEKVVSYRDGDDVGIGEFILIYSNNDKSQDAPFILAKVEELGSYDDPAVKIDKGVKYRPMVARIYGNRNSSLRGVFRPGWYSPRDDKHYFAAKPVHYTHPRYKSDRHFEGGLTTYNVILAGFKLDENDRIPIRVIEEVEKEEE